MGLGARVMPSSIVSFTLGIEGIYNFLLAEYYHESRLDTVINMWELAFS